MQVDVYKNLHKSSPGRPVYSVRSRETGRVIAHCARIALRAARYVVGVKGRERVCREKRKNVHAVVRGELVSIHTYMPDAWAGKGTEAVTYNPYKYESFVLRDTEAPLESSEGVYICPSGVYAVGEYA